MDADTTTISVFWEMIHHEIEGACLTSNQRARYNVPTLSSRPSKTDEGSKRRMPPGPLPSQGEKYRAMKSVKPHHPPQEYLDNDLQPGKKHLFQRQAV
eukprot:scaffold239573_cov16-Prasinocladus_malaysianus.AAC.1